MSETIHQCPPEGSGLMPCCDRTPFEVPRTDRMTVDLEAVTCGRPPAMPDVLLAATAEEWEALREVILETLDTAESLAQAGRSSMPMHIIDASLLAGVAANIYSAFFPDAEWPSGKEPSR